MKTKLYSVALTAAVLGPVPALAQTVTTDTFEVRITIAAECNIISTEALDFGTEGVLSATVETSATLQVACTETTPYNIGLDEGGSPTATTTVRQMQGVGGTIDYGLYQDGGRSTNWGDAIGTDTQAATGTGSTQSFTVYGQVLAQATPAPGAYTDTVTVSVTY